MQSASRIATLCLNESRVYIIILNKLIALYQNDNK